MLKLNEELSNGTIEQAKYSIQFDKLAKETEELLNKQKKIKKQEIEQEVFYTRMKEM